MNALLVTGAIGLGAPGAAAEAAPINHQSQALTGNTPGLMAEATAASPFGPESDVKLEGTNGNKLVCGGVPTKSELIRLANGGADSCGNTDIAKAWADVGMTAEVAKTAVSGTICSDENMTSQGRKHSPNPGLDKLTKLGEKTPIYERPLSAWGKACYDAWVAHGEDGRKVGVLKGCGNGEGHHVKAVKMKPVNKIVGVEVFKIALDAEGHQLPSLPTSTFEFAASCIRKGKKITTTTEVNTDPQHVIDCDPSTAKKKRYVTTTELATKGNEVWTTLSPVTQTQLLPRKGSKKSTIRFTYKDQEVAPTPPQTPGTPPKPTDVCANIAGDQAQAPVGTVIDANGNCVQPFTGRLHPGLHTTVNGVDKVCTDNVNVNTATGLDITDVRLTDTNGAPYGTVTGPNFVVDATPGSMTICFPFKAGSVPGQMNIFENLTNGVNTIPLSGSEPIVPDTTPTNTGGPFFAATNGAV